MGALTTPTVAELANLLTPEITRLTHTWCGRLRAVCEFIGDDERTFPEIQTACNLTPKELTYTHQKAAPLNLLQISDDQPHNGAIEATKSARVNRDALNKLVDSSPREPDPLDPEEIAELLRAFDVRILHLTALTTTRLRDAFLEFVDRPFIYEDLGKATELTGTEPKMLVALAKAAGILVDAGTTPSPNGDARRREALLRFDIQELKRLAVAAPPPPAPFAKLPLDRLRAFQRLDFEKAKLVAPALTEARLRNICRVMAVVKDRRTITRPKLCQLTGISPSAVYWACKEGELLGVLKVEAARPKPSTLTAIWEKLGDYKSAKGVPDFNLFDPIGTPVYERTPTVERTTPEQDELLASATPYWRELAYDSEADWLLVRKWISVIGDKCDDKTEAELCQILGVNDSALKKLRRVGKRHIRRTKRQKRKRNSPKYSYETLWAPIEAVVKKHAEESNGSRLNGHATAGANAQGPHELNGHAAIATNGHATHELNGQAAAMPVEETPPVPPETLKPTWDAKTGRLSLGNATCSVGAQAKRIEKLINAFDDAGWPPEIKTPFTSQDDHHKAIYALNQKATFLKLNSTGRGAKITWKKREVGDELGDVADERE